MSAYGHHRLLPPRTARSVGSAPTGSYGATETRLAREVRRDLTLLPKSLPAHLFYDAVGSKLYERISALPEYYLTRAEQEILETHADDVAARAADRGPRALTVVELGAGSATKTEALLRAVLRHQRLCEYVPIDVSHDALLRAEQGLRERLGTPEEIAQIIVFLASDRSSFVSGHILSADGGKVAR